MKKTLFFILITNLLVGGGIVHNTNQSADFIRTLNRNATNQVDAVYFNPSGLTSLENGYYLYLSNQTIWQTRTITATYPAYNSDTFEGKTFVPVFPNIYVVKKQNNLAFSLGLMPIGGGGSAEFQKGLPSFDKELAKYVYFSDQLKGYMMKSSFVGSSVYLGFQGNVSYKLNDMISTGIGIRMIKAKNTYEGYLKNASLITVTDSVLTNANYPLLPPDINVDSERNGVAFTPIFNVGLRLFDMLYFTTRYEPRTTLKMLSDTKEDGTIVLDGVGMFPDDSTYRADIPGQLAFGLNIDLSDRIQLSSSYNYYLYEDSKLNWDGKEKYVQNGYELGVGIEYGFNENLNISFGFLHAISGAQPSYQEDVSYSLNSNTLGTGFQYRINPNTFLSIGFSNTIYAQATNNFKGTIFEERYDKTALDIAVGLQRSF